MNNHLSLAAIGIGCVALLGHRILPEFTFLALIGLILALVDLIPRLVKDSPWRQLVLPIAAAIVCALSFGPIVQPLLAR